MEESQVANEIAVGVGTGVGLLIGLAISAVIGLVIGALARLLLPGRDDMSLVKTVIYGVGGSILGGLVGRLIAVENSILGLVLSVLMAMALIWLFTRRGAPARTTT